MHAIPQSLLLAGVALLLVVPGSSAQNQGGGGGQRPPSQPTPAPPANSRGTIPRPERERGVDFVTGRVVTEEGTPPPEIVSIERVCGSSDRREGYTDSKGYFSLQLGSTLSVGIMQDASVSGGSFGSLGIDQETNPGPSMRPDPGVTEGELMACDLRASLAGYQSTRIPLVSARLRTPNNVGVIVLYSMARSKATTISVTSMQAPKDAKKAVEKARKALVKNKPQEAIPELQKAVSLYPRYAEAWFDLGFANEMSRQLPEARSHYQRALEIDEHFIRPYVQL
ncbi:MAG: tetratricopeptide repeat protein, partial [Candidatus Korobacteraceae bacterium]